jgi:PPK2 family polyphosphate:nucleotide phosphotransferase
MGKGTSKDGAKAAGKDGGTSAGKAAGKGSGKDATKPAGKAAADGTRKGAGKAGKDAGGDLRALLRVPPGGGAVDLAAYDTSATPGGPGGKQRGREEIELMRPRLAELQEKLFAQSAAGGDSRRVLLVLQGMDTSGKGGTVKHVVAGLNPAGLRVRAFKAPTAEEQRHHFLWRVRKSLPLAGEIGVFDRSHYEDVLVARVHGLVPRTTWRRRYGEINRFERALADDGTTLVKVFLHIGYDEQRDRLLARLDRPDKHWKFTPGDLEERALWPAYQEAYETVLERCSTEAAPWYVVPADHKWYRNWAISRLLLEHLEELGPKWPRTGLDVADYRRRLLAS